jgi:hypothetical protein
MENSEMNKMSDHILIQALTIDIEDIVSQIN